MAKGAGMIHPDMATMLSVIATDTAIAPAALAAALRAAVEVSFNAISVDGDTSTNDTVLVLANGASGWKVEAGSWKLEAGTSASALQDNPSAQEITASDFAAALADLCTDLAQQIVRDGEGATKFITVRVTGAASDADARLAAKAVANSPLVKTAFYGGDANWGRILAAAGYAGVILDPDRVNLAIAGGAAGVMGDPLPLVVGGLPTAYAEADAAAIFAQPEIHVTLDLDAGGTQSGQATVWTCDLSHDYVSINADYRT